MLYTITDANRLIAEGNWLHIAGDAAALAGLDRGNWVGGTIPYFLTSSGGRVDREGVFITAMPAEMRAASIGFVAPDHLAEIPGKAPAHGFSLIVMPAGTEAHTRYAIEASDLPNIFETPVIGWVAGVHLDDLGKASPMVVDGRSGEAATDRIVVLRAELPDAVSAEIGTINLFHPGPGDRFRFPKTGFAADACLINGTPASLYGYAKAGKLNPRLPLVATMSGESINVSIQAVDDVSRVVNFYAPVQAGVEYRQAAVLTDYHAEFSRRVARRPPTPAFCRLAMANGMPRPACRLPMQCRQRDAFARVALPALDWRARARLAATAASLAGFDAVSSR